MARFEVQEIRQEGYNTCWMAACNMIHLYYYGRRLFWENSREADLPGNINEVARLNNFTWVSVNNTFAAIQSAINDNRLLLADTTLTDGQGHAVLISGYRIQGGRNQIYVLDPAVSASQQSIGAWLNYGTRTYRTQASEFSIAGLFYAQYS